MIFSVIVVELLFTSIPLDVDPPSHDSKVKTKQTNERWLCRVQDLLQNH